MGLGAGGGSSFTFSITFTLESSGILAISTTMGGNVFVILTPSLLIKEAIKANKPNVIIMPKLTVDINFVILFPLFNEEKRIQAKLNACINKTSNKRK